MGVDAVKFENMTTTTGKCYVGMTRDDAKATGKSVFREFKRINKDGDDILSFDEIANQRNKKSSRKNIITNICFGIATFDIVGGLIGSLSMEYLQRTNTPLSTEFITTISKNHREKLLEIAILIGIGLLNSIRKNKINDSTDKMAQVYYQKIASLLSLLLSI